MNVSKTLNTSHQVDRPLMEHNKRKLGYKFYKLYQTLCENPDFILLLYSNLFVTT